MTNGLQDGDPMGQPLVIGQHMLPGIWRYMMPREFLKFDLPAERRSTCMDCPKACYEGFRPDYRCCTYLPRIPNYLLGMALDTASGRKPVESLKERGLLTPEGMYNTPVQWINYLDDIEHEKFGKSELTLCPMLDRATGYCNIHPFRNSVCSTFFCLKDHGDRGDMFWESVQSLGGQIEAALCQWALAEAGFDVAAYLRRFNKLSKSIRKVSDPVTKGWTEMAQRELWGDHYGLEFDLLRATTHLISDHRDVLWEIARDWEIGEAKRFDKAMIAMVPKRLEDQIDEGDLESGEPMSLDEIWRDCEKAYRKLWKLGPEPLVLNPRVIIHKNLLSDEEQAGHKDKPHELVFLTKKGGKRPEWREFLTANEAEALAMFRSSRTVDWQLLAGPLYQSLDNPKSWLAEWVGKKVLIRAK